MISVILSPFKKSLGKFLVLFCLLAILIPLLWSQIDQAKAITATLQIITQNNTVFLLLRVILIATLIVLWPKCIVYFAHKKQWNAKKTIYWQKQRWIIAAWLMIIEFLVCENLPLHLIKSI